MAIVVAMMADGMTTDEILADAAQRNAQQAPRERRNEPQVPQRKREPPFAAQQDFPATLAIGEQPGAASRGSACLLAIDGARPIGSR